MSDEGLIDIKTLNNRYNPVVIKVFTLLVEHCENVSKVLSGDDKKKMAIKCSQFKKALSNLKSLDFTITKGNDLKH